MVEDLHLRLERLLSQHQVAEVMGIIRTLPADAFDMPLATILLRYARKWHAEGHFNAQRELCEMMLSALPGHPEALHLLGFHAQTEGDFAAAERYYTEALANDNNAFFSQLALSQMQMLRSGFQSGKDLYEARFDAVTDANGPDWRGLPITRWQGQNLVGKSLYLWAEQGLGDVVMFAGFLPSVMAQHPRRLVLGVPSRLIGLFARSFPAIHIESLDDVAMHALAPAAMAAFPNMEKLAAHSGASFPLKPLKDAYDYVKTHGLFDYAAPMGDLMVYLTPEAVPADIQDRFLVADPEQVEKTRKLLTRQKPGRKVGISWHTTNPHEPQRNISLEQWLPLLATPGCHFVSLQHQVAQSDIELFCAANKYHITVAEGLDFAADGEGLPALIASMDEVITIDNSTIHLAGSLGIPSTLLLPLGHNYRWPLRRNDGCLWYKSVKILRQKKLFQWDDVLHIALMQLKERVKCD